MISKKEALREIHEALNSPFTLSTEEVFDILGIEVNDSLEDKVIALLGVAINPHVRQLPKDQRLAVIKTCQSLIGELFFPEQKNSSTN